MFPGPGLRADGGGRGRGAGRGPCCARPFPPPSGAGSDAEAIHALHPLAKRLWYEPDRPIVVEGDRAEHVFGVLSGVVLLHKALADGRRQVTGLALSGELFGLCCYDRYCFGAAAAGRAEVCRVPRRGLADLCALHPEVARRLHRGLCDELTEAQAHILRLGRNTAAERLASFLLMLSRRAERRGQPGDPVALGMTRADIADYLGLKDETVSRTFSQLAAGGLIALPRPSRVALLRRDRLAALAEGAGGDPEPVRLRRGSGATA